MLRTIPRRAAAPSQPSFLPFSVARDLSKITVHNNRFQCKRSWPPDFNKLSPKHQFKLERRYKRRTQLKWARPKWTKFTQLAQWGCILGVLVYGVLFMQVGEKGKEITPFDGIRRWYREQVSTMGAAREGYVGGARTPERTWGTSKEQG